MATRGRPRAFDRPAALRQAMQLFWQKGYEATSLPALVEAMGINSPSIYAAFGDKAALFREAAALYEETEGPRIWGGLDTAPTACEGIAAVLQASAHVFTERHRPPGCLLVLGALSGAADESVREDLRQRRKGNLAMIQRRLQRALAAGELPPGADVAAIALFYATVQQGMSLQARDGCGRKALVAIASAAMAGWDGLVAGE